MGRLYMTPSELLESPLGLGLAASLQQLGPGVIDKLLMRASQRCDSYCQKRLQALASTTLSAGVSAGTTTIAVASTLTFDDRAEQAVIIGSGATQETVLIQPGGVTLSQTLGTLLPPYPGTFTLATPLAFGHGSGESVVGMYQEITEVGSVGNSDPYTEALATQTAQLALAHLPPTQMTLSRVAFVNNYPIIQIMDVQHSYSYDTTFNHVDLSGGLSIEPLQGWIRFRVGTVLLKEGLFKITYSGGYQVVPDDIKVATSYFFAEQMQQMINPYGLRQLTLGKRSQGWDTSKKGALVQQAEECLKPYRRTI